MERSRPRLRRKNLRKRTRFRMIVVQPGRATTKMDHRGHEETEATEQKQEQEQEQDRNHKGHEGTPRNGNSLKNLAKKTRIFY